MNRFSYIDFQEQVVWRKKKIEQCLQISHCLEVPDGAKVVTFKKFLFEMFLQQAFEKDLERLVYRNPL